jgi:hypothetical protein
VRNSSTIRSRFSREREIVVLVIGGFLAGSTLFMWLAVGSYILAVADFLPSSPTRLILEVLLFEPNTLPGDQILRTLGGSFLAGELVACAYLLAQSGIPLRFVAASLPLAVAAGLTVEVPQFYEELVPRYAFGSLLLTGSGIGQCAFVVVIVDRGWDLVRGLP